MVESFEGASKGEEDVKKLISWMKSIDPTTYPMEGAEDENGADLNRCARMVLDLTYAIEQILDENKYKDSQRVAELMEFLKCPFSWGSLDPDVEETLHFRRAALGYYYSESNKDGDVLRFVDDAFESFIKLLDYRADDNVEYEGDEETVALMKAGFLGEAHICGRLHFCELVILSKRQDHVVRALGILRSFEELCGPETSLGRAGWNTERAKEMIRELSDLTSS